MNHLDNRAHFQSLFKDISVAALGYIYRKFQTLLDILTTTLSKAGWTWCFSPLQTGTLPLKPGPLHAIDGDNGINEAIMYSFLGGKHPRL